jgi:hypothetical protein
VMTVRGQALQFQSERNKSPGWQTRCRRNKKIT